MLRHACGEVFVVIHTNKCTNAADGVYTGMCVGMWKDILVGYVHKQKTNAWINDAGHRSNYCAYKCGYKRAGMDTFVRACVHAGKWAGICADIRVDVCGDMYATTWGDMCADKCGNTSGADECKHAAHIEQKSDFQHMCAEMCGDVCAGVCAGVRVIEYSRDRFALQT